MLFHCTASQHCIMLRDEVMGDTVLDLRQHILSESLEVHACSTANHPGPSNVRLLALGFTRHVDST